MKCHPNRILAAVGLLAALAALWHQHAAIIPAASTPLTAPQATVASTSTDAGSIAFPQPVANLPAIPGAPAPKIDPALARFTEWTGRYLARPDAGRADLLVEGRELAAARRAALAQLIRTDPRAALAAAVPMVVRQQLPAEIVALLEERVAGRGELAFNAVTPLPGQPAPAEPMFRTALIDGREYRAHVFGRRDIPATIQSTSLNGIALDGHLAVAESPLRVLEKGEVAADRPLDGVCGISGNETATTATTPLNTVAGGPTAVEYNGVVHVLCGANHLAQIQARLESTEEDQVTNAAAGGPGSSGVVGRPEFSWTHGPKKLLVIRVDFSDKPGTPVMAATGAPMTETNVADIVTSVKAFYTDNSFGQTSLELAPVVNGDSPDISPVLRMPQPSTYYAAAGIDRSGQLHQDAENAAAVAGINLGNYDRVGVAFSYLDGYWWAGLGNITGRKFWINGYWDFRVVSHELGHTYGMMHANYWQPPSPYTDPISMAGTSIEYADYMDVMGSGSQANHHFSQWNKSILQWIPDTAVTTIETSGTYRVHRFDDGTARLDLPRALKLRFDDQRDYWIGFRGGMTEYNAAHGAYVLWGYHFNQQGNLLNLGAPGRNWTYDMPLPVGETFTDNVSGVSIHTAAEGGTGADRWLDVQVNFFPAVRWAQSGEHPVGEQDGTVTLTVVRAGDPGAAASVEYTTVGGDPNNAGAVAGADYVHQSGVLSWTAGDMSPRTIVLSIISDNLSEGGERFTVSLSNPTGARVTRNAAATVNIIDRDIRDFGHNPDEVTAWVRKALVLPDGGQLLGGAFQYVRDSEGTLHNVGRLAKFTPEGRYVPEFTAAVSGGDNTVYDLALQPDGKILVAGSFTQAGDANHPNLARLLPDGTVDPTFSAGANAPIRSVKVQADGKILLGGHFTQVNGVPRSYVARLNADGSLDGTFSPPALSTGSGWSVSTLTLQPDGRILVGGLFALSIDGNTHSGIFRLMPNGGIDNSFTTGTGARDSVTIRPVRAIAVLPDGRVMVGGEFTTFNGQPRNRLARLSSSGGLDPGFTVGLDDRCTALLPLPDGRLVIGGCYNFINTTADKSIAILLPNDTIDTYFASLGGFDGGEVSDIIMLPNGRIQFCGSYQPFQYSTEWRPVWRFMSGVEHPPGWVRLQNATLSGNEGGSVTLTVTRTGGSGPISVNYATAEGSATVSDYTAANGVLTWADGDSSSRNITVNLATDSLAEAAEAFTFNLGAPLQGGVHLGAIQQAVITIQAGGEPPTPNGWTAGDIGTVGAGGSSSESGGVVTVAGSGGDIWGAADAFQFRSQPITGDGALIVRVASTGNTHPWAKVGIMFREDLTPGSREVMAFVSPGNHSGLQYRLEPGGQSAMGADTWSGLPVWLMLVRSGDTFGGYRSYDGVEWTPLGTINCNLPDTAYVGFAVSSHVTGTLLTATFDHVELTGTEPPPGGPPAAPSQLATAAITASTVALTWTDNSTDETGFAIERAPGSGGTFAAVGTAPANSQAYTDAGLSANTTYTYRIRSQRGTAYSSYSNTTLVTTTSQPPSSWQGMDIGSVGPGGSETIVNSTLTVKAGGTDIWFAADGFRFVYQALNGDGEIKARVASLTNTHPWAKAGVMFRETLAADSRNVAYVLTADNTSGLQVRSAAGGDTTMTNGPWVNAPHWIRLVRSGNTFTASTSPDGFTWTTQSTRTVAMGAALYVGVATSAHTTTALTTAVFENVQVSTGQPPPPPPPPPPGDWTQTALGAGSGSFTNPDATSVTVNATGADIWGQFDDGVFVQRAWSGDGEIVARLESLTNTHPWAKAGLMFRESLAATSANVFVGLTPTNGVTFQVRGASSAVTGEVQHNWLPGVPCWLKLTRTGNTFTAAFSSNGTTWTALGSQTLAMGANISVGFGVSSHAATPISAVFRDINLPTTPPPPPPPPPPPTAWTQTVFGNASGSFNSPDTTQVTVTSTGDDFWGQADSGLFIQRGWTGDGTITARVDSQSNTHPWAKAGVMFRESLGATSANVFVGLTPSNGVAFQVRATSGAATTEPQHNWLPGAPCWVRLTRAGNVFTAAFSTNGTTWTSLGSQTVALSSAIYTGFAVSAHGPTSGTAAFSGVQVQ